MYSTDCISWRVYGARLKKVEERLAAVRNGDSQEYVKRVQDLRGLQYKKDMIAWQLNERKLHSAQVIHDARKLQSKQTLEVHFSPFPIYHVPFKNW